MNVRGEQDDLLAAFPALAELDRQALATLRAATQTLHLPKGTPVFEAGDRCQRHIMVRGGRVRVHLLDADGHEIVLYRLGRGDTCILTTAALLGRTAYAAFAITETPTLATALSVDAFNELLARSPVFQHFVFASQGRRIADLMRVVSDVAFTRLNVRLIRCLLERAEGTGSVSMTHEALAVEIGTAREVVSRNLKALERNGLIKIGPSRVKLLDLVRLEGVADGGAR